MLKHSGFSLLEVAIAMGIMAVGLSGLCALLLKTVSGMTLTSHRATAAHLSVNLAHQATLSPGVADRFQLPVGAPPDCVGAADCSPADFAHHNLARWQASVQQSLPGGQAFICRDAQPEDGTPLQPKCDGTGPRVVKIFWRTSSAAEPTWARQVGRLEQ